MPQLRNIPRKCAQLLAMTAFYAAQWKERTLVFIFRGDWRTAELVSGIGLFSTGRTKVALTALSAIDTPLELTYHITGICDMVCAFFVIGAVLWSHGKDGNNRFRGAVNIVQFCLWALTAYIYWLGYSTSMFQTQHAMWQDHFAAIIVMLIVVGLDFINIAAHAGEKEVSSNGN